MILLTIQTASDTVGRNPANHLGCKKPPTYYQLVQVEGRVLLPVIGRVITPLQGVKKKNGYPVARPFMEFITIYTVVKVDGATPKRWISKGP